MKTKLLFVMFVAIGMMLATSCSNDEQVVQSGDEVKVTFSLGLESSMNTRAISDGTGINQLFYAIFDSNKKTVANTMMNTEQPARNCYLPRGEKGEEHQAESSERPRTYSGENFVFGAQCCSLVSRLRRK